MTITTGRYITFKSIYLGDTGQQFLCDFFRSAAGDRYTVQVELAHEWTATGIFNRCPSGSWEPDDSTRQLPPTLLLALRENIQLLEAAT